MTLMHSCFDEANTSAVDWCARATLALDEISQSMGAFDEEVTLTRLARDREEIREHVKSLRRRLTLALSDPRLAVRLQAELSQLEWTTRICVLQLRRVTQDSAVLRPGARAS